MMSVTKSLTPNIGMNKMGSANPGGLRVNSRYNLDRINEESNLNLDLE